MRTSQLKLRVWTCFPSIIDIDDNVASAEADYERMNVDDEWRGLQSDYCVMYPQSHGGGPDRRAAKVKCSKAIAGASSQASTSSFIKHR